MKCTVCSCEIEPNKDVCQNCGTRLIEMGVNAAPKMDFVSPSVTNTRNETVIQKNRYIIAFVLTLIAFVAAFVIYQFQSGATKQYNIENFTVTLPKKLYEDTLVNVSQSKFDDSHSLSVKARGKYSNVNMDFQYLIYDYSKSTDVSSITEETFLKLCESQLSSSLGDTYEQISLQGNKLKCSYNSSTGADVYNYVVCKKSGNEFYVFFFGSSLLDRPDYEHKFENWANTIRIY